MKRKTKNTLSLTFLIITCSLFLWNCEQEEHVEHQTSTLATIKNIERHVVSLSMLEKTNILAYEVIVGLSKEGSSNFSRSQDIYSEEYDLYYDLDKIYIIEEEHYQQYSFLVKSSNQLENQFENYILIQYPDDTFRQYIITYQYNSPDRESYDYVNIRELEGNQLFTRSLASCPNLPQLTPITITYCTYTQCTGNLTGPGAGGHNYEDDDCQCGVSLPCSPPSEDCTTETQWVMTCPGGGDGSTDNDCRSVDCENDTSNGGANGGTGEDPDEEDIPVIPIEIDYAQEIINCMNVSDLISGVSYSLSQSQQDWVNAAINSEIIPVYNFLVPINSCDPDAREFSSQAIEALMEGGEVDYEDRIVITPSVPECVKDIIKKIQRSNAYIDLGDMPDFVKEELNLNLFGEVLEIFSNSDNYHINFKVGSLPLNSSGQQPNANTDIINNLSSTGNVYFDITLDSNYISNATDLSIARSIIHECIHAYISYIYQTQLFSDLSNSLAYILSVNGDNQNTSQHILMTQEFIEDIAYALATWDSNSISNTEYYNYLSWSGAMQNTTAFNSLSSAYQQNSIDANIAEQSNSSTALGQKNCI